MLEKEKAVHNDLTDAFKDEDICKLSKTPRGLWEPWEPWEDISYDWETWEASGRTFQIWILVG